MKFLGKPTCKFLLFLLLVFLLYFIINSNKIIEGNSDNDDTVKALNKLKKTLQSGIKKQLHNASSVGALKTALPSLTKNFAIQDTISKAIKLLGAGGFFSEFDSGGDDDDGDGDDDDDDDNGDSWF